MSHQNVNGPRLEKGPRLPIIAMTDLADGWMAPYCMRCRSRMWLTPPDDGEAGDLSCLLCTRQAATVVEVIRPPVDVSSMLPERRGRPSGTKNSGLVQPPCRVCRERPAKAERRLCGPCQKRRETARAS